MTVIGFDDYVADGTLNRQLNQLKSAIECFEAGGTAVVNYVGVGKPGAKTSGLCVPASWKASRVSLWMGYP